MNSNSNATASQSVGMAEGTSGQDLPNQGPADQSSPSCRSSNSNSPTSNPNSPREEIVQASPANRPPKDVLSAQSEDGNSPDLCLTTLANEIIAGKRIDRQTAKKILQYDSKQILSLLDAAYQVRHHFFGNQVKLNYLVNAKSGLCPEDCSYCSQAKGSEAEIAKYKMMTVDQMVDRADQAVQNGASTCCLVISGRGPSNREVDAVSQASRQIKEKYPDLKICACLGILKDDQAKDLKQSGVDRYNHNLNTAPDLYKDICSTHTFEDRKRTVQSSISGGLSACSGLIVGMNETDDQIVETVFQLRSLDVDSIPVNFLVAIEGTPFAEGGNPLNPQRCLQILCMVRMVCPDVEVRCSAGRETHLRHLQPMSLYPANSWFVSDYLTTPGQEKNIDHQMIEDLGFEVQWAGPKPENFSSCQSSLSSQESSQPASDSACQGSCSSGCAG